MTRSTLFCCLSLAISLTASGGLFAQFSPGPNPITGTVGAQTLSSGTGTINVGGAISIASGSTVPLTMTGTSTLNNNGTIQTTGSGRAIDSNSGTANLTITNTGLISSNTADAFRVNTSGSSVQLTNSGTIQVTNGGQAIDWASITTGTNILINQATGSITTVGEDAVRPGQNGQIDNAGIITATPTGTTSLSGSDGIDLRTEKTVTVTNTGTITGRHGIATDGANVGPSSLTVNNNAGTIQAINGSGINVDGVSTSVVAEVTNLFGATIKGGVAAGVTDGDGDGIDIDGVLTLYNSGDVLGLGARGGSNNAEGIAAGGGSITNYATGQIIGSSLLADAPNGDSAKQGNGILIDDSNGGNAVAATVIDNSGLIWGKTGFGIKLIGSFADTITNQAGGAIRGAGAATGAAIQTGGGNDTINNSGAIIADSGVAIDMEGGNNKLNILGGAASVSGDINGGSGGSNEMVIDPGASNSFSYAGSISNFSSVEVKSGTTTLSGASSYTGFTVISGGALIVINTTGSATGGGDVTVNSGAKLGGNGMVGGSVILGGGGIIAPGLSPDTLSIGGDLDIVDTSTFQFELGGVSDLIDVAGILSFTGGGAAVFDIFDVGMVSGSDYTLIEYDSVSGLTLANLAFGTTPDNFIGNFVIGANALTLHVSSAPEPSRALLLAGGLLGIALRRRRSARGRK